MLAATNICVWILKVGMHTGGSEGSAEDRVSLRETTGLGHFTSEGKSYRWLLLGWHIELLLMVGDGTFAGLGFVG